MAIVYAVVARDTVVLAEFSAVAGNSGDVVRRILEKFSPDNADSRLCFPQDRYIIHILRSDGLTFLCVANEACGRRAPFSYLEDLHEVYEKLWQSCIMLRYAMNDEFSRVLHQQMEFFSTNPNADTLNRVRGEVNEMHSVMIDNIDKILERGDRIELIVDKATMQDRTFHFRKQSKRLRRAIWMKNAKLLVLLICLIVLLLYIFIATFCGGITIPSCRS